MDPMEALLNQPPRDYPKLEDVASYADDLWSQIDCDGTDWQAEDHATIYAGCIAAAATFVQMRADVRYRDSYDEQLTGLASHLSDLNDSLIEVLKDLAEPE